MGKYDNLFSNDTMGKAFGDIPKPAQSDKSKEDNPILSTIVGLIFLPIYCIISLAGIVIKLLGYIVVAAIILFIIQLFTGIPIIGIIMNLLFG